MPSSFVNRMFIFRVPLGCELSLCAELLCAGNCLSMGANAGLTLVSYQHALADECESGDRGTQVLRECFGVRHGGQQGQTANG